jgi:hypothetical protein
VVAGTEPAVASPGTTHGAGPAGERARRPALDGLRAVAVLLVLVAHFAPEDLGLHGGTLGVDVFFVLSGYLITGLLLAPGTLRPRMSFLLVERPQAAGRLPLVGASVPRQLGLLAGGAAVTVAACILATARPGSMEDQASARAGRPGGSSSSDRVVGPHASTTRGMIIGRRR